MVAITLAHEKCVKIWKFRRICSPCAYINAIYFDYAKDFVLIYAYLDGKMPIRMPKQCEMV